MSASPVPQPADPIRAICRTPASYFHTLLSGMNYSEILCFGLILDLTVGRGTGIDWAFITQEEFIQATNQSWEWISGGLERLENFGYIRRRQRGKKEMEYRVAERFVGETDIHVRKFTGRCPDCKTVGQFQTEYIAVPHPFFRKLGACLDHASYICLAVIVRYSLKWTGKEGVWTESKELELNDFERLTGLDKSSVSKALAKLCDPDGWGLVVRKDRPGKPSSYRAIPERFGKIDRRGPRLVEQPPQEKEERTPRAKSVAENPNKTEKTHGIESVHQNSGFCLKCRHFVTPEEVSEEELLVEQQERPQKKPLDRTRGTPEPQIWSPQPSYKLPDWKKEA